MNKNRLKAFSDGVIAIIITIMVLEIKVPHGAHLEDLLALWPVFLSYVLTNLSLLFWLSLMPFTTAWVGENHFASTPMAVYAVDLCLCAVSYTVLQLQIIKAHGPAHRAQAHRRVEVMHHGRCGFSLRSSLGAKA
jgi:uncharacterized membrane protein